MFVYMLCTKGICRYFSTFFAYVRDCDLTFAAITFSFRNLIKFSIFILYDDRKYLFTRRVVEFCANKTEIEEIEASIKRK